MNNSDFKIVADSSSDILSLDDVAFASAPLKIITSENEYIDDENLNVDEMVDDLSSYKGKSGTSCPSVTDWLDAFGDAKYIFCITITNRLSGSHNSACLAKQMYEEDHPDRQVCVIDSLSTGPEMNLISEKLRKLINAGKSFEEISLTVADYQKHLGLLFMLESLKNLANNGRVNSLVAKAAGVLGVRIVGKASDEGELELLDKCRGEQRALNNIIEHLKKLGHKGGKIRISHCSNENAAKKLKELIIKEFKTSQIEIYRSRGLCSFYAEKGGLLVGFEKM